MVISQEEKDKHGVMHRLMDDEARLKHPQPRHCCCGKICTCGLRISTEAEWWRARLEQEKQDLKRKHFEEARAHDAAWAETTAKLREKLEKERLARRDAEATLHQHMMLHHVTHDRVSDPWFAWFFIGAAVGACFVGGISWWM